MHDDIGGHGGGDDGGASEGDDLISAGDSGVQVTSTLEQDQSYRGELQHPRPASLCAPADANIGGQLQYKS